MHNDPDIIDGSCSVNLKVRNILCFKYLLYVIASSVVSHRHIPLANKVHYINTELFTFLQLFLDL